MFDVNDDYLFETRDPRGRIVVCTKKCWYEHILANRAWMEGWEDRVIATIKNPSYGIFQDPHHENRCIYYRRQAKRERYIKVVVKTFETNPDRVITAFPSDSMKSGETWIWIPKDV